MKHLQSHLPLSVHFILLSFCLGPFDFGLTLRRGQEIHTFDLRFGIRTITYRDRYRYDLVKHRTRGH